MTPFFLNSRPADGILGERKDKIFIAIYEKSYFRTSFTVVISLVFARLPSFPIPLTSTFRDYLAPPPTKSQFHIFHNYVYEDVCLLEYVGFDSLLWLFMSSDGGHCPNDQPKNCNCTFFSKRSS